MEYLQYGNTGSYSQKFIEGFKPYYKWNTFNTLKIYFLQPLTILESFKTYYKWNTFNTNKHPELEQFMFGEF